MGKNLSSKKSAAHLVDSTMTQLRSDYTVMKKTHIRAWHAWLAIGIVVGAAVAVILVANRSRESERGRVYDLRGILKLKRRQ